ncbi:MAG: hypothetical protein ACPGVO_08090 [Spirulinaceae cyanobacterium]
MTQQLDQQSSPLPSELEQFLQQSAQSIAELQAQSSAMVHQSVETVTATVGQVLQPIATHPAVESVAKLPWLGGLLVWMGQVDVAQAQADVDKLRAKYPTESEDAIARRIIQDTVWNGGRVGLMTNIVPPVALALLAVDLAAVTQLQAQMLYRLAAAYRLDLNDPARRGEVVTMYGASLGGSTPIKAGLSVLEMVPGLGALVGASSNAVLLYILGETARQFYAAKQKSVVLPLPRRNAVLTQPVPVAASV